MTSQTDSPKKKFGNSERIGIPSPSWKIILFGWLFILVIPIVSLLILVGGIIENEESDLLSNGKDVIVRKRHEETSNLRPESRLKNEFLIFEKKLGFPTSLRGRKHSFEKGTHSPLFPERLLPVIQN